MKTAPEDISPHPDFNGQADAPPGGVSPVPAQPEVTPTPASPEIRPEPGYPGVTPDPQPEIEPAFPGGDTIEQPATTPEVTPLEPAEIQPLP